MGICWLSSGTCLISERVYWLTMLMTGDAAGAPRDLARDNNTCSA